jgi:VanZ family protein
MVAIVLTASINPIVRLNKILIFTIRLDYLLHLLLFVPWMVLARWRWVNAEKEQALFYLAAGAGLFLAALSEIIQHFMPIRSFSLIDLAADSLGIFLGALLAGWGRVSKAVSGK